MNGDLRRLTRSNGRNDGCRRLSSSASTLESNITSSKGGRIERYHSSDGNGSRRGN